MPDYGPAVGALFEVFGGAIGSLVRVASVTLLSSAVGAGCGSLGLLIACFAIGARGGSTAHGWLAIACCAGLVLVIAPLLVVKRAIGRAVLHGLGTLWLGRKLLSLVFDDLVRTDDAGAVGDRGTGAQRALERMPVAEVERKLKTVVARLTGEGDGFFARRLRTSLLVRVERYTLAELRAVGEHGGGVDLALARQKLKENVDQRLVAHARSALNTTTALLVAVLIIASLSAAALWGRA